MKTIDEVRDMVASGNSLEALVELIEIVASMPQPKKAKAEAKAETKEGAE